MVVHNFNVKGIAILPDKADAPLFVNADTVLPGSVSFQGFQPVSRRHAQIVYGSGIVNHFQFAQGRTLNVAGQARDPEPIEQGFTCFIGKGFDHGLHYNPPFG